MSVKSLVSYAVAVLSVLAMYGCASKPAERELCMIAHRGYSSKYLENTEVAFLKAAEHGSGGIETDVRITADGVLVCSHNSTAVLKDSTELAIATSTYAELTAQPLLNKHNNGDNIYLCTFKRYLEICRDNKLVCFIELKGEFPDEKIKECFNMAKEVYELPMCELQSFNFDNLVKAHKMFPDLKIMLTYGGPHDGDYRRCFDYGFDIDTQFKQLTPEFVEEFHSRGLKVAAWTANTQEDLDFCKSFGLDFIESDVY